MIVQIFDKKNIEFKEPKAIFTQFVSMEYREVLNGEEMLTFVAPYSEFHKVNAEDFINMNYQGRDRKFVVKNVTTIRDENGRSYAVEAEGLYSMLIDKVISPKEAKEATEGEEGDSGTELFGITAEEAIKKALEGTRFEVGQVDDFGTWDIDMGDKNVLEVLKEIRDKWVGVDVSEKDEEEDVPPEITDLTATSEGTNVVLRWTMPDDEKVKRILIYRGIALFDTITEGINPGGQMEYVDKDLDPGTVYHYRLYTSYDEDDEEEEVEE